MSLAPAEPPSSRPTRTATDALVDAHDLRERARAIEVEVEARLHERLARTERRLAESEARLHEAEREAERRLREAARICELASAEAVEIRQAAEEIRDEAVSSMERTEQLCDEAIEEARDEARRIIRTARRLTEQRLTTSSAVAADAPSVSRRAELRP